MTDTMNMTRMVAGVSWLASTYWWTNQASMPMMGIRMMISKKRHARKRAPEIMLTVLQLDTQLVVLSIRV